LPGTAAAPTITGMPFELTEHIQRRLSADQIAWLTTVSPTGRPSPRPVWFVWEPPTIVIYSKNDSAKLRHLAVSDKVSVHFDSNGHGGDIVVIAGRAELDPDAPPPSQYPGLLEKYSQAVQSMGQTPQWYDTNYGVALRVTPHHAWTIPG
jgi:PPOX class probable F420-dependent enzyme